MPFFRCDPVQFRDKCVGGETLILLTDAGLQQQVQFAPAESLYEQFLRAHLIRRAVFSRESRKRMLKPLREFEGSAEVVDLRLCEFDRHLYTTFPAALFDVVDRGLNEGFSLHRFRTDEKCHAKLRV